MTLMELDTNTLDADPAHVSKPAAPRGEALVVGGPTAGPSLQDAFLAFRARRVARARQVQRARADPERLATLRARFVDAARGYLGVPYAAKYHGPESEHHAAPLYLDCCGLVRRVLDDLEADLGFRPLRFNQAYQFDTLPDTGLTLETAQPGDLVFYSGAYYSDKKRKQKHDMVHVEILLGNGSRQTIGARWQKKVVQIHDDFEFTSKTYHSITHHFRSIDPWLSGVCKSVCAEHPWRDRALPSSKRSIFADGDAGAQHQERGANIDVDADTAGQQGQIESEDEGAGDDDGDDDEVDGDAIGE
jgi:cell wall-associated NlpC family hydrolase